MENDENILWHYTKMETLIKIFPPKNSEYNGNINLRFTNIKFLDDFLEGLVLKQFLIINKDKILEKTKEDELFKNLEKGFEALQQSKKEYFEFYTFSLSRQKDCLYFWDKEYAGTEGVSIGFNKEIIQRKINDNKPGGGLFEVGYLNTNLKTQTENEDEMVDKIIEDMKICCNVFKENLYAEDALLVFFEGFFCSIYKYIDWKNENEERIIFIDSEAIKLPKTEIKVEILNNTPIKCFYKRIPFEKDIIKSIILGPKHKNHHKEAIEKYLKDNGYDIKVELSHAYDLTGRVKNG